MCGHLAWLCGTRIGTPHGRCCLPGSINGPFLTLPDGETEIELLKYGSVASRFDCTIYVSPCGDMCASGAGFPTHMQRPYYRFSLCAGKICRFVAL